MTESVNKLNRYGLPANREALLNRLGTTPESPQAAEIEKALSHFGDVFDGILDLAATTTDVTESRSRRGVVVREYIDRDARCDIEAALNLALGTIIVAAFNKGAGSVNG